MIDQNIELKLPFIKQLIINHSMYHLNYKKSHQNIVMNPRNLSSFKIKKKLKMIWRQNSENSKLINKEATPDLQKLMINQIM